MIYNVTGMDFDFDFDMFRNLPDFDCYDPHADLLELAIWAMTWWVDQNSTFLNDPDSEYARLLAAAGVVGNVSNDSSARADAPAADPWALAASNSLPPAVTHYLKSLQYFFSASQLLTLMRPEAERRLRPDLVERLTPASVGRLLSELGLPRDRTAQGRRFRLTLPALTHLLSIYPYVFHPDEAQSTYTRRLGP